MLNNDRLSDVKFVATKTDGESESKQVIPAHKFILAIGSPVFEAMFYGELAETKDTIELPDCDYESLLELFRYMYSDEVNLSGSNVMGVLYLAKKYIVPSLADKCTEYLQENMDPSNVFGILPSAQKYEEKALVDRCWKVIENQTGVALKSEGFETIERSLLEQVVARDILSIKEVSLFKAVDRWATKQCEKQSLTADGQIKRRILGEQIVKAIRFPVMRGEEFASDVVDTNILTSDETTGLFKYFLIQTPPVGFLTTRRRPCVIHRCERFQSQSGTWNYGGSRKDFLGFTVNKNIFLHGLCLFGSYGYSYTVTLEIKDTTSLRNVGTQTGTYSSKLLQSKTYCNYYGFEVLFDSPTYLKKNTPYLVEALVSGPQSGRGSNGFTDVEESGVTFSFSTVERIGNNNTDVSKGQFPHFLFSV